MKFGLFVLLNGLFVFGAAHIANVPIEKVIAKSIEPVLAATAIVQHFIG
jgi:hypothetical protein